MKPSLNWLLIFVPITLTVEHLGVPLPVLFFCAALALIPIAGLIVQATEQIALRTNDAVGGLLNATFGNAPELIIGMVALRAGLLDMVRASLIGAILANLLLALGLSFFLGGIRYHVQRFNPTAARTYSTMMLLAAVSMGIPSAFSRYLAPDAFIREERLLNVGIAVLLLLAYGLYLWFSLVTHADEFASAESNAREHEHDKQWSSARAAGTLVVASVLAAWMSEILVGAAEGTGKALGMSSVFIGIVLLAIVGGAAESGSAITMARRNKMDLTIGIALGSSIQIALFVAPMLVLTSHFLAPQPLNLSFGRAEVGSLFLGVILGALVCGDGEANWYKGVQLATIYIVMALMFFLIPQLGQ
jgi:Ca2+:H+ antiporter